MCRETGCNGVSPVACRRGARRRSERPDPRATQTPETRETRVFHFQRRTVDASRESLGNRGTPVHAPGFDVYRFHALLRWRRDDRPDPSDGFRASRSVRAARLVVVLSERPRTLGFSGFLPRRGHMHMHT